MADKAYLVTYRKQNEKVILKELFKDKDRSIEVLWDNLAQALIPYLPQPSSNN